jgi:hypothetical protein
VLHELDEVTFSENQRLNNNFLSRLFVTGNLKEQTRNIGRAIAERPVQSSFVPGLGTHGKIGAQVVNKFSLNILGGYTAGVNGLEIAGLFNIDQGDVRYTQIAGLFNVVGGGMQGVQIAGLANTVKDTVRGLQLAGVSNYCGDRVQGMQLSGVANVAADSVRGLQRLHARKPARSASSGVAWNATFLRSARRAPQLGRQYTPVLATE